MANFTGLLLHRWSDGTAVDYVTWAPNQPDDRDGELECLVFSSASSKDI